MIAHADNPNIAILEMAVQALGELTDSLVFIGGCATGLLVTRIRANQIRVTEDVDVIAEAATITEYHGVESRSAWKKVLKRACIRHFRWHDLRHHFASRLVQQGTPLNTVRDLLGHSSVGMSLRYAHLAPDQRREAVAKLNERPLLALAMHVQWEHFPHSPEPPTSSL
jgi:integrase